MGTVIKTCIRISVVFMGLAALLKLRNIAASVTLVTWTIPLHLAAEHCTVLHCIAVECRKAHLQSIAVSLAQSHATDRVALL